MELYHIELGNRNIHCFVKPFNGVVKIHIRQFSPENFPTKKGIALSIDEWRELANAMNIVHTEIEKQENHLRSFTPVENRPCYARQNANEPTSQLSRYSYGFTDGFADFLKRRNEGENVNYKFGEWSNQKEDEKKMILKPCLFAGNMTLSPKNSLKDDSELQNSEH